MNSYRWLLILDDQPGPMGPEQRYRLWLVELDEDQPAAPVRCDSLDEVYQALLERLQNGSRQPLPDPQLTAPQE